MRAKNPRARKISARESGDSWQIYRDQMLSFARNPKISRVRKKSMHPPKKHVAVASYVTSLIGGAPQRASVALRWTKC